MMTLGKCEVVGGLCLLAISGLFPHSASAQTQSPLPLQAQTTSKHPVLAKQDYNQRLQDLARESEGSAANSKTDYQIGPEDLLDISVLEAPDLNRTVRVSEEGEISLPLVGIVPARGFTSAELEASLERRLGQSYLNNPHVTVFVHEMKSHAVSVFGAVEKPGVFQIRSAETLIQVLSMAQGLADDAGDTVIVLRHGMSASSAAADSLDPISAAAPDTPAASAKQQTTQPLTSAKEHQITIEVNLKDLIDSGNESSNVMVYPGDIVKVPRAGIVYVVGEVHKPGGFLLRTNENVSVLQALALAEGLTRTSSARHARIIRTDEATGVREELPIDLGKILAGRAPDPMLHAKDIVYVPNSAGKSAFYRGTEAALSIAGGIIIYRR